MTTVAIEAFNDVDPLSGDLHSVRFPYDSAAVDLLKMTVPHHGRQWSPTTKTWLIDSMYVLALAAALREAGHRVRDAADAPLPPPTPTHYDRGIGGFFGVDDEPNDFDVDGAAQRFVESIPYEHRGKVFRSVAKLLYPDLYSKGRR